MDNLTRSLTADECKGVTEFFMSQFPIHPHFNPDITENKDIVKELWDRLAANDFRADEAGVVGAITALLDQRDAVHAIELNEAKLQAAHVDCCDSNVHKQVWEENDKLKLALGRVNEVRQGMWLLISKERVHNGFICWWRPNSRGYTYNLNEAGSYTGEEANRIEKESDGKDVAVPWYVASVLNQQTLVEQNVQTLHLLREGAVNI